MGRLFVSATRQNVGKTTTSVGLFAAMRDRGLGVHFIKPIGQRYLVRDDVKADEDAILIQSYFGQGGSLADMSPVTIPRGFTERYVHDRDRAGIYERIDDAMSRIDAGVDVTIVEGTGHAGVGSVIDASNADVARHLGASAIVIASGGIGSAIDEICLNHALFEQAGVPVLGAIVNKVLPEKYDKVAAAVRQGLANQGIPCLGVVPFAHDLTLPTVRQLSEELNFRVVAGHDYLDTRVSNTIVAAMTPQNTIGHIHHGTFVITPGDRVDNILVSIAAHLVAKLEDKATVSGILLTGGMVPDPTIRELLEQSHVPVLLSNEDTFHASARVEKLTVKIRPTDREKVEMASDLARRYLDLEAILGAVATGRS
jgi:BioD-like phosphotransacetylase family protein